MKKLNWFLLCMLAILIGFVVATWKIYFEDKSEEKPKVVAALKETRASRSVGQGATGVDLIPEMEGKDSRSIRHPQAGIESGQQPSASIPAFATNNEIERLLLGEFNAEEAFQRGERYLDKEISDKADINDWDQYSWCFKIDDGAAFIIDRTPITVGGKEVRLCQLRLERKETMNLAGVMRDSFTEYFGLSLASDGTISKATYFAEFHVAAKENRDIGIEPLDLPLIVDGLTWEIKDGDIYVKQSGMMKGKSINPRDFPSVQIVGDFNLSRETQEKFRDVYRRWLTKIGVK